MFSSQEGVLFDKKGETLLVYPYNREEEYTIPDGVKSIMDYAFYLTIKPDIITLPKSITEVGFGAFGDCSVDEIYFCGKRPIIGEKAFKGDSLIAYYPKGDNSWEKIENETYEADDIKWKKWNMKETNLKSCDVTITPSEYFYCGEECKPDVVVKHGDIILKQGIDYEVSYKDNIDSGTGHVLISAIDEGNYTGSLHASFTIHKKSIEQCKIVFKEIRSYPLYTNFNMDYFVVLDKKHVLQEDVDFEVLSLGSFSQSQGTNVSSEIEVEIRGLDNYFGFKTEKFRSINKEPKLVSASRSSDGVKLRWEKESGALGYIVYRKIGSGNFEKIYTASSNNTTSWMDKNISNDKISYYIKTYTTDGKKYIYSDRSNIKSIDPAFSIRSLSNKTKGIELTWSKVSGATRYEIYRKTSGQNFRKIKTIVKGTTFTDVSVKNGSGYSYKVRANGGTKISSPEKKIVRLTTPSITSAKNVREKGIYLKWRKNSRASGYQIRYTTGSSKKTITVKKSSSVAKTISRLKKGKIYQVSVRSYRTVSSVTYYSDYSKIKRVKIYK